MEKGKMASMTSPTWQITSFFRFFEPLPNGFGHDSLGNTVRFVDFTEALLHAGLHKS